ncbi:MAG: hypothetical protein KatS3mg126_1948 [Lysobacteraceae bacterium]|nr:MAG: hypothetical protein KatS3mg126_1948 [Xanthomonadaceae bacterium]
MQERFETLLERHGMETDPARRADLERLIWQEFGCERAVLVLDMADFTRLSQQYGLVHYLSMIQRMRRIAAPVVVRKEGVILKFEADNAFVMFPDVEPALQCAFELDLAFREANRATPDELDIRIACGIDHGPILVVPGRDFWGQAVIRASKLGEDLAEPGRGAAHHRCGGASWRPAGLAVWRPAATRSAGFSWMRCGSCPGPGGACGSLLTSGRGSA